MVTSHENVYQLLVERSADGLSLHTTDGIYLYASPAFEELLGCDPRDLVGRDCYELFHPEDVAAIERSHRTVLQVPSQYTVSYRIRRIDGTYRWVETTSRYAPDDSTIVAVTRSIDARISSLTALELERARAEMLEQAETRQREFFTAISHRARQPITVVMGMIELLAHRWMDLEPDRVHDLLQRVATNARQLGDILNEVTLADAVIRRAVALERRPVNLARIGHASIEALASPDAPISLDIPERMVAFGDADMIGTTLRILLANAVVHTPVGTRIWLRTEQTAGGVVIIVDDNGPGVAPTSRETIFEPFTRGSEDHHDPGLGLGLATVAQVAALHGGRAWVEDRRGGGASFRVLLPQKPVHAPQPSADPARRRRDRVAGD